MQTQSNSQTTIRIARVVSLYLLVTGFGFLVSADFFREMISKTGSDPVLINLSGMVHFFIGATILVLHFRWRRPLELAVSIVGILFSLKGAFLIALPELTLRSGDNPAQDPRAMGIGFLLFGGLLAWAAFAPRRK